MKEVYSQRNKNNFNNEYCLPNVYPKRSKINLLKGIKRFKETNKIVKILWF